MGQNIDLAMARGYRTAVVTTEAITKEVEKAAKAAEKAAKEPRELIEVDLSDLQKTVNESVKDKLIDAYKESDKQARSNKISDIKNELLSEFSDNEDLDVSESDIKSVFKNVEKDIVRGSILDTGLRIDGRDLETVRPVQSDVSILPLTHGSALFTRGETQALVVTTLGTGLDEKFVDGLDETYKEKFKKVGGWGF